MELSPTPVDDLEADFRTTGLTLGRHPVAFLRAQLRHRRVRTTKEILSLRHGAPTRACGLITMRQRPSTASGTVFLTLEDETGTLNVVVWPRVWERHRAIVLNAGLLAVDGILESDGEVHHLIAGRVHDYSELLENLNGLRAKSRDFC